MDLAEVWQNDSTLIGYDGISALFQSLGFLV